MPAKINVTSHISFHTVALSSSKILKVGKLHRPLAIRMTTKTLMKQTSFAVWPPKYFKNTHFLHVTYLQMPSPKRPVAETAALNCPRPNFASHRQISSYVTCHFAIPIYLFVSSYVSSGHVFSSFPQRWSVCLILHTAITWWSMPDGDQWRLQLVVK